jgi:hypothetical protein
MTSFVPLKRAQDVQGDSVRFQLLMISSSLATIFVPISPQFKSKNTTLGVSILWRTIYFARKMRSWRPCELAALEVSILWLTIRFAQKMNPWQHPAGIEQHQEE